MKNTLSKISIGVLLIIASFQASANCKIAITDVSYGQGARIELMRLGNAEEILASKGFEYVENADIADFTVNSIYGSFKGMYVGAYARYDQPSTLDYLLTHRESGFTKIYKSIRVEHVDRIFESKYNKNIKARMAKASNVSEYNELKSQIDPSRDVVVMTAKNAIEVLASHLDTCRSLL